MNLWGWGGGGGGVHSGTVYYTLVNNITSSKLQDAMPTFGLHTCFLTLTEIMMDNAPIILEKGIWQCFNIQALIQIPLCNMLAYR